MHQDPQIQDMVSRLRNLHSLYANLTLDYLRLPLSCRRYLYGSSNQPVQEVPMLAEAKFILAASLQWIPSNWGYDVDGFAAAVGRIEKKANETGSEVDDELCPIWLNFFTEMVEVDRMLASYSAGGLSGVAVCLQGDPLLLQAESKFLWIQSLTQAVAQRGYHTQQADAIELTDSMIFSGWNRFCWKVAKGMSVEDAVAEIRTIKRNGDAAATEIGTVHSGKGGCREYFAIQPATTYQPWMQVPANRAQTVVLRTYCRSDSPCRRVGSYCPCEARGQECDNSNCLPSGPWKWQCWPAQPQVERITTMSYPAAYHTVEEAEKNGQLFDGVVHKQPVMYNAIWDSLTPIDNGIPWPTISFALKDLRAVGGLPLPEHVINSIPQWWLVAMKTKAFFLSSYKVAYDIGVLPLEGPAVVPKFSTFDTQRMKMLLRQMLVEKQRWSAVALSYRTNVYGYREPALGDDWMSWAVRDAVEDLIETCVKALAKAKRAEEDLMETNS